MKVDRSLIGHLNIFFSLLSGLYLGLLGALFWLSTGGHAALFTLGTYFVADRTETGKSLWSELKGASSDEIALLGAFLLALAIMYLLVKGVFFLISKDEHVLESSKFLIKSKGLKVESLRSTRMVALFINPVSFIALCILPLISRFAHLHLVHNELLLDAWILLIAPIASFLLCLLDGLSEGVAVPLAALVGFRGMHSVIIAGILGAGLADCIINMKWRDVAQWLT